MGELPFQEVVAGADSYDTFGVWPQPGSAQVGSPQAGSPQLVCVQLSLPPQSKRLVLKSPPSSDTFCPRAHWKSQSSWQQSLFLQRLLPPVKLPQLSHGSQVGGSSA